MLRMPNDRLLVYGGIGTPNHVWVYDIAGKIWTVSVPTNSAPVLVYWAGVYDSVTNSMIVYDVNFNKLTAYSFATNSWANLRLGNSAPFAVSAHMSVLSSQRVMYIMGTSNSTAFSGSS